MPAEINSPSYLARRLLRVSRHYIVKVYAFSLHLILFRSDEVLTARLLRVAPFMVPFSKRLELYNQYRISLKRETQSYIGPPSRITIRRDALFDTTYRELKKLTAAQLRGRMDIKFINEYGVAEEGIDAGGLFKELWTQFAEVSATSNRRYQLWQSILHLVFWCSGSI